MQNSMPCGPQALLRCRVFETHVVFSQRRTVRALVRPWPAKWLRGAATSARRGLGPRRSSIKVQELPQGLLMRDNKKNETPKLASLDDEDRPYSVTIQQARDNMDKFDNCVVITRVGSFYELYFEQAEKYAPLLGIKLAAKRSSGRSVPMAGFPFFQLDRYLKVLVQDFSCYVAISEEFPNTVDGQVKSDGLKSDRRVTRVVSPGTLIDERFLDSSSNNFCLALYTDPDQKMQEDGESDGGLEAGRAARNKLRIAKLKVGLAWLDLSTGESFTQSSTYAELPSLLTRIGASEMIMDRNLPQINQEVILDFLGPMQMLITWQPSQEVGLPAEQWNEMFDSPISQESSNARSADEEQALSMVLGYVKERLQDTNTKLQTPVRRRNTENMTIDRHTLRGLEIIESIRGASMVGARGSLLHAIRRTVTYGGARLLRDRITSPSAVLSTINHRLDLVGELCGNADLKEKIQDLLSKTFDTKRLVSKFALGRGEPDDLVSLSRTIGISEAISELLKAAESATALQNLRERLSLDGPAALSQRIANAIDEQGLIAAHEQEESVSSAVIGAAQNVLGSQGNLDDIQDLGIVARAKGMSSEKKSQNSDDRDAEDGWIMRKQANEWLSKLHGELETLHEEKRELAATLRDQVQASTLTLQWAPKLGHFCHVRKAKDVQSSIRHFPTSRESNPRRTTRSFHVPEWSELGARLDLKKVQIREEEKAIFLELRDEVVKNLVRLRRNATILDELDVACSSATLAKEQNAVRPILDDGASLEIVGGRHPTVVLGLEEKGRPFVANDCFLNTNTGPSSDASTDAPAQSGELIHLVTGPNMAGKSTFLRQNALFTIMAQVGLFVPAAYARIGVVDALFARIGSADDLFADQSTFMTEMLEVAGILRNATARSVVVMDEVGRGTTPDDGLAVAYAALWHLGRVNRCRALFATHFHDLADMTSDWDAKTIGRYCTDIKEAEGGGFVYLHRIRRGVNRNSHALKVASLAGVPREALDVARGVQEELRKKRR